MRSVLVMLAATIPAAACSCVSYEQAPACEVFYKTPIVFRGRVIDHNHDSKRGFVQWTLYRFRVEEAFKGLPAGVQEIFIDPGSFTSCYGEFESDRDHLIYAGGTYGEQTFAPYYARVKNAKGRDGSVKPLPPAWQGLGGVAILYVPECTPSRTVEENDPDLSYLREASKGQSLPTGFIQGMAAQNVSWPFLIRDFFPVSGANITAKKNGHVWTSTTGPGGSYAIDRVPAGKYAITAVSADFGVGNLVRDRDIEVPSGGCAVVPVSFNSAATISGTVLDPDGRPASEMRVEIGVVERDGKVRAVPQTWTETSGDGKFTLHNVPVGRVVVMASAPSDAVYAPGTTEPTSARIFILRPGEQVRGVALNLPRHSRLGKLFVDVQWPDGSPATGGAGAFATRYGQRNAFERAPKAGGRVTLSLAVGRTYDISVNWFSDEKGQIEFVEGASSQTVDFSHDGQAVTLTLKEPRLH